MQKKFFLTQGQDGYPGFLYLYPGKVYENHTVEREQKMINLYWSPGTD